MKKVFISSLIMALMVANISSVQAATTDNVSATTTNSTAAATSATSTDNAIKVSLANIKDIIIQNNPQAKILDNNKDNAKLTYDNVQENAGDVDSAKAEYNDAQDAVDNFKGDGTDTTDLSTLKKARDDKKDAVTAAENALDKARYNLRTSNIDYSTKFQALVEKAQNDYIAYLLNDLPSKEYNTANVELLKKAADAAKIQYDSGFISKNDYTTAQLNYTKELNTSNSSNDTEENDKANLYYDLGISSGEKVTFDTSINQDIQDVSKLNYDNDLVQMFGNSLQLQEDNIGVDQASDEQDDVDDDDDDAKEVADNNMDNAQMQVELDKNNSERDFKAKYDALLNSYATMKNGSDSLDQQKNVDNNTQISYDYGFASQQSVDGAKVDSLKTSQDFEKNKSTFYTNYLSYIQAKEGY